MIREIVRKYFPAWFKESLHRVLDPLIDFGMQARKEVQFLLHLIRERGLFRTLVGNKKQEDRKFNQHCFRFCSNWPDHSSPGELTEWFHESGFKFKEGAFTWYFPPSPRNESLWERKIYPRSAGLKVLKATESCLNSKYVSPRILPEASRIGIRNMPSLCEQLAIANTLWLEGIGPRIFDLIEIETPGGMHPSFVVEHINGECPSEKEHMVFLEKLKNLFCEGTLSLVIPNYQAHIDFRCPDCNNNLIKITGTPEVRYVDFQNFFFKARIKYLRRILERAREDVHFGDSYILSGGRHLYQSVPEMSFFSKRNTSFRFSFINSLLMKNSLSFSNRLVLDVGCNTGMMLFGALASGARWGLGWDLPHIISHTRRLLFALGFSRFDLFQGHINENTSFIHYVPEWCIPEMNEAIVFFLAMRKHIGFPGGLAEMPWRALIYEGHQDESEKSTHEYLREFCQKAQADLVTVTSYKDARMIRPLAIVIRTS